MKVLKYVAAHQFPYAHVLHYACLCEHSTQVGNAHECNRLLRQLLPGLLTHTLSAMLRSSMVERNYRWVPLQAQL